ADSPAPGAAEAPPPPSEAGGSLFDVGPSATSEPETTGPAEGEPTQGATGGGSLFDVPAPDEQKPEPDEQKPEPEPKEGGSLFDL
ncbi:MAG: hypothetical protein WB797_01820, partial [Nocardioides sp.]